MHGQPWARAMLVALLFIMVSSSGSVLVIWQELPANNNARKVTAAPKSKIQAVFFFIKPRAHLMSIAVTFKLARYFKWLELTKMFETA